MNVGTAEKNRPKRGNSSYIAHRNPMGKEQLRTVLERLIDLRHPEIEQIIDAFEPRHFAKKEFLIREGETERFISFLVTGAVKVAIPQDGNERILDFWFDNSFFSSYSSLLTLSPSRVYIQALTDTSILRLEARIFTQLYETSLLANKIGRLIAEQLFMHKTRRERDFLTKSATERYKDLLERHPAIVHTVPIRQIASYLGIHPESLSRIR